MALPLGRTNNPNGRPKGSSGALHANTIMGSLNTRTLQRIRQAYETNDTLLTPLEIFFMIMNSQTLDGQPLLDADGNPIDFDWKTRLMAADKASGFFHAKLPQNVEVSGPGGSPIAISNSTARLEDILFGEVISDVQDVEYRESETLLQQESKQESLSSLLPGQSVTILQREQESVSSNMSSETLLQQELLSSVVIPVVETLLQREQESLLIEQDIDDQEMLEASLGMTIESRI